MYVRDHQGLLIPSAFPAITAQQVLILRVLGRVEYANTAQIASLFSPPPNARWLHRQLERLIDDGVIWKMRASFAMDVNQHAPRTHGPPLKQPSVYGLTTMGKTVLETLEAESDPHSLQALKAREPGTRPPNNMTMRHDLQVSWWCTSLLHGLRRHPLVRSVFVQVEFTIHERQRMDAIIIIRVARTPRPIDPRRMPFFDGTAPRADEVDIRLALEVDRSTEPLKVLLAKGATYRDLHAQGTYSQAFGGPVLPVFLVPSAQRAAEIAREWRRIWPDGWGVIATALGAAGTEGVLNGDYRTLHDGASFPLLTILNQHPVTNRVRFEALPEHRLVALPGEKS